MVVDFCWNTITIPNIIVSTCGSTFSVINMHSPCVILSKGGEGVKEVIGVRDNFELFTIHYMSAGLRNSHVQERHE